MFVVCIPNYSTYHLKYFKCIFSEVFKSNSIFKMSLELLYLDCTKEFRTISVNVDIKLILVTINTAFKS